MDSPDKQLETIGFGTVEILPHEELVQKLKKGKLRIKFGADPSAPDLHLGHLVVLKKLQDFQKLGHHIVFIIGDFTARIGDPSGRSKTRPALSEDEVNKNARTYQDQIFKILDRRKTEVVFNSSWLGKLSMADVVRLMSQTTVARMLERDDFHGRFKKEEPISVHEFLYPFLQAYDSVAVKADVEVGGTDQKFNLLLGREIQKAYGLAPQAILTMPLLEGTDGVQKMSKSLENSIGITDPPKEILGKIMSIPDALIVRYRMLLLGNSVGLVGHPRAEKMALAKSIVEWLHSSHDADQAEQGFNAVFSKGEMPSDIPEKILPARELDDSGSISVPKLLVCAEAAPSLGEAQRLIKQGGVRIDGEGIKDEKANISVKSGMVINVGKRLFVRLKVK